MRTRWMFFAAGVSAVLIPAIVNGPWATGQQPARSTADDTPTAQPEAPAAPAAFTITSTTSNPFDAEMTYAWVGVGEEVDPEIAKAHRLQDELERQVRKFLAGYADTKDQKDRDKIKSDLTELLDQQFDLQRTIREHELSRLEAKVKKLRDVLEKRVEQRKSIVERRVEQLILEAEGLGWSDPDGGVRFSGVSRTPAWRGVPSLPAVPGAPTLAPLAAPAAPPAAPPPQ